ncbi:MAG: hypothetical protein ACK4VN_16130 [Bacteroidales bacterium]
MNYMVKHPIPEVEFISYFKEALYDASLKYRCDDLFRAGFDDDAQISEAVLKSIQLLKQLDIPPHHHFRNIYITELETGKTYKDWRMSKAGFLLTVMNCSRNNPALSKWKMEMVKIIASHKFGEIMF